MAHVKRNSIGSQLPLPTTIALPDSPSTPGTPHTTTVTVPPSPVPHGPTFTGTHPLPLNTNNILLHNSQFSAQSSTTHAGGIQPSASFFKPKRPVEYSQGAQRYPPPSALGVPDAEDESSAGHEGPPKQPPIPHLVIPHPLSPSFATGNLSPSLSQHHHHHSNHSLDDMREHEDRGIPPSDTEEDPKRMVNPKLSREPLIDSANTTTTTPGPVLTILGTPTRIPPINTTVLSIGGSRSFSDPAGPSIRPNLSIGPARAQSPTSASPSTSRFGLMRTVFGSGPNADYRHASNASTSSNARRDSQEITSVGGLATTKASRRTSLDASITTKKTKRNSLVYKPRLTFESLRRNSSSKDYDSDRRRDSSYIATEDETEDERVMHARGHSHGRHPFSVENDGIPLTPTKSGYGRKKASSSQGHGRSESVGTPRKDRSRRNRSSFAPSGISSRSRSPMSSRSSSDDEGSGASTPAPGLFNPTPPPLGRGEYPKMKTPLRHPLDPSLIPVEKLEKELALRTKRRKKQRGGVLDRMTNKRGGGDSKGLPTVAGTTLSSQSSKQNIRAVVDVSSIGDKGSRDTEDKPGRLARRYELHPSRNRFALGGRIMTGGDSPWAFMASLCVLFGLAGVWFGTTGVWWWRWAGLSPVSISLGEPVSVVLGDGFGFLLPGPRAVGVEGRDWTWVVVDPHARRAGKAIVIVCAYLCLVVMSSMFVCAFSDPGVLPRGLDPDPPYPANSPSDGGVRVPMPRDLKVRDDVVRVKYCPTCKTYRPPRASHCKMCDNCVDGCDHHCQWINNCVGSRNYTTFFVLLMSATLTLILVIVTSALNLYYLTVWQGYSFKGALSEVPGSAVAFCLAIVVIWPVGALLSYHLRLLLLNITTIEQIRNQAHKSLIPGPAPPNPFSHGSWRKNFIAVLCRPQPLSWLDAAGVATEDRRDVNPGMFAAPEEDAERSARGRGEESERGLRSARSDISGWEVKGVREVDEEDD